jgi:hypothetical protein
MAASVAVTCGLYFNKAHAVGTLPRHAPHPDVWTTGCFAGTHAVMCSNTFATIDLERLFSTIPLILYKFRLTIVIHARAQHLPSSNL